MQLGHFNLSVLGKTMMKFVLLFNLPQISWINHAMCIFRAVSLLWYSFLPQASYQVMGFADTWCQMKMPRLPRSARALPRNGPPSGSLLHQLFPQHLSHWQAVWWKVFGRNVQAGPPGWLQVRNSRHSSLSMMPFDWIYLSLQNSK